MTKPDTRTRYHNSRSVAGREGSFVAVNTRLIFFFAYFSYHTTHTTTAERRAEKQRRRRGACSGQKTKIGIEGEDPAAAGIERFFSLIFFIFFFSQVTQADTTIALFTKDGDTGSNLLDMQCMWYELECGASAMRTGDYGRALKNFKHVEKHFSDIQEVPCNIYIYIYNIFVYVIWGSISARPVQN